MTPANLTRPLPVNPMPRGRELFDTWLAEQGAVILSSKRVLAGEKV